MNETNTLSSKRTLLFLIVIVSSIFIFRILSLAVPIWNLDEAVSACIGNTILDGGIPYKNAIDHRGPVTYYAYALIFYLFGKNNMVAIHIALSLLMIGVAIIVFLCGTISVNRNTGMIASFMFFILSSAWFSGSNLFAAHTEHLLIGFSSLAMYLLIKSLSNKDNPRDLFLCGICYGMAFFSKQPALLDFLATLCFLVGITFLNKNRYYRLKRQVFLLLAGFMSVSLLVVGYFYVRDGLQDFLFYFWTYNTRYYIAETDSVARFKAIIKFLYFLFSRLPLVAALFISGIIYIISRSVTIKQDKFPQNKFCLLFVFWAFSSMIGSSLSGRTYGHYYIQVMPAICLITGVAGGRLLQMIREFVPENTFNVKHSPKYIFIVSLRIFYFISLLFPVIDRFYLSLPPYSDSDSLTALVNYVEFESTPSDRILVWGFYPEIYVLTNRMPASKYIFSNFLTGLIPLINTADGIDTTYAIVPGSWDIFMNELYMNRPILIVDTSPGSFRYYGKYPIQKFPLLFNFMTKHYDLSYIVSEKQEVLFKVFKRKSIL